MRGRGLNGQVGRARPVSGASRPGDLADIVLVCALVREAVSAWLDGEEAPAGEAEVQAHLGRCADCRRFQQAISSISSLCDQTVAQAPCSPPARPPKEVLAVLAAAARGAPAAAVVERLARPLRRWSGRPSARTKVKGPWAVPAMVAGIALPCVSFATFSHFQTAAHAHRRPACETLLLRYPDHR
jgi:hypothetical protein